MDLLYAQRHCSAPPCLAGTQSSFPGPIMEGFQCIGRPNSIKEEGCPILTTCSSREIIDSSGATRTSRTSSQVVNVTHFSEIT